MQADELLALSTVVILLEGEPARVMCEMVGAVDAQALGDHSGHLTIDEIRAVDDALELVLDLR